MLKKQNDSFSSHGIEARHDLVKVILQASHEFSTATGQVSLSIEATSSKTKEHYCHHRNHGKFIVKKDVLCCFPTVGQFIEYPVLVVPPSC